MNPESLGFCEHAVKMEILNTITEAASEEFFKSSNGQNADVDLKGDLRLDAAPSPDQTFYSQQQQPNFGIIQWEMTLNQLKKDFMFLKDFTIDLKAKPATPVDLVGFEPTAACINNPVFNPGPIHTGGTDNILIEENINQVILDKSELPKIHNTRMDGQFANSKVSSESFSIKSEFRIFTEENAGNLQGKGAKFGTLIDGSTRDKTKLDSTDEKCDRGNFTGTYGSLFGEESGLPPEGDVKSKENLESKEILGSGPQERQRPSTAGINLSRGIGENGLVSPFDNFSTNFKENIVSPDPAGGGPQENIYYEYHGKVSPSQSPIATDVSIPIRGHTPGPCDTNNENLFLLPTNIIPEQHEMLSINKEKSKTELSYGTHSEVSYVRSSQKNSTFA